MVSLATHQMRLPVNLGILNQKGSLYVTRPSLQGYITTREELTEASNELFSLICQRCD